MPAICCRTAASLASDGLRTVFRFGRVIRFLRMIHFLSQRALQRRQGAVLYCCGVIQSGKCYCSPEGAVAAPVDRCEHGAPPPFCAVALLLAGAARRLVGSQRRSCRNCTIARFINPGLTERR